MKTLKILPVAFLAVMSAFSAFAQDQATSAPHLDLHSWVERAVKDQVSDPFTADDLAALKQIYTTVHAGMISQIEAEAAQASLPPPNYLHGDLASVSLMRITRSVLVDATVSAEDLWFTFLSLKMRRIYQQVMGSDSAHYLTADNIAYKKLLEIRTELKSRGLHLPGVNIIKSMNTVRD